MPKIRKIIWFAKTFNTKEQRLYFLLVYII